MGESGEWQALTSASLQPSSSLWEGLLSLLQGIRLLLQGIRNLPQDIGTILSSLVALAVIFCHQPLVVPGIAGLPNSWWDILTLDLDLGGLLKEGTITSFISIFGTILAFVRPTIPGNSPDWLRRRFPVLAWFLFSDESMVRVVGHYALESPDAFVYINGICTTRRMALHTGEELADMLHKNITVVHNPTDSLLVDLFECVIGKLWTGRCWATGVPCTLAFNEIKGCLLDNTKTKVVLISHSQGTIIASDVLWHLWRAVDNNEIPQAAMQKLEMYSIANAAHQMYQRHGFPYMESICNQKDNVGMLGANAPENVQNWWGINLGGKVIYPHKVRWGHMILSHYLKHFKAGDYKESKLHEYTNMARA